MRIRSGDERHLRAGTGISTIRSKGELYGYLSSYIKKSGQKIPPEGFEDMGRFWGSSRNLLIKDLRWIPRVLLFIASILLVYHHLLINIIGCLMMGMVIAWQKYGEGRHGLGKGSTLDF